MANNATYYPIIVFIFLQCSKSRTVVLFWLNWQSTKLISSKIACKSFQKKYIEFQGKPFD